MGTARVDHTATLLPNGKVLVAGGFNESGGAHQLATAELYDPAIGTWLATGSLAVARSNHTAVLLANGKVLVIGGFNGSYLASAEVFDPTTGSWVATGSLATGCHGNTATLLPNGKVLVTGGYTGGYLSRAELYDPATGAWTGTGALNAARAYHTAILLSDGKVLIAGGYNSGGYLAGAEIYDPGTGTFSVTGSLSVARARQSATVLPNGKVLVAAGTNGSHLSSAEVYDPAAGTWAATGGLATARSFHSASLLANGKLLIAGGLGATELASCELYDYTSGIWTATSSLSAAHHSHTSTLLANGGVLVIGGANGSSYFASTELFSYAAGSWSATGSMGAGRYRHTATSLLDGNILVAGGQSTTTVSLASAEKYDPSGGTWSGAGSLSMERGFHTATLLSDGTVLVAGGTNGTAQPSAEIYEPGTNTWSVVGNLAGRRLNHSATLLPTGKVLVAGGDDLTGYLASAELYDPVSKSWTGARSLVTARQCHSATLLPNGKVLVAGGYNGSFTASVELYDPVTDTWGATGGLTTPRDGHTATLLSNGKVLVAGGNYGGSIASAELYDPGAGTWSAAGSLVTARAWHDAVLLPTGRVLVVGGLGTGANVLASAELYDPVTSTWSAAGSLATTRCYPRASLLRSGRVLVTGGYDQGGTSLASAELFDSGLGYQQAWQPVINTATSPLGLSSALTVGGTGFKGISEASGGGYQSSATNYPLVQVRSMVNDQMRFMNVTAWSDTSATTVPVEGFPVGNALVTVFTNGIPSASKIIQIGAAAPAITSSLSASGTVGAAFSYTITATNTPTSFGATGLPTWAAVNTSTGAITGTPDAAGTTNVTISATNANGTDSKTLQISIASQAPAITSTLTATGTVGQAFSYTVEATGATPITFSAAPLPAGLTFSGATISGTPTEAAQTNVTLGASNAVGSDSKTLVITINPTGAPTITSALAVTAIVDSAFSYKITATGNATITFNATNLPAWATFATDTISGSPPATGTSSVTISASNGLGTDTKTLEITINRQGAPQITSNLTATGKANTAFSYTITATGDPTIGFSAANLPSWLTLNGATLSGTPTAPGSLQVGLTATNASGSDTKTLQISIAPETNDPPVVTDIIVSRNPVRTSTDVTFTAQAVSLSGLPLSYNWHFFLNQVRDGAPMGGQTVTRGFTQEGEFIAVVVASDGFRDSAQFQKLTITLAPNPNGQGPNITDGQPVVVNPENGLGIHITGSLAGVVDVDVAVDVPRAAPSPYPLPAGARGTTARAGETYETRFNNGRAAAGGTAVASKFQKATIFVAETIARENGVETRKVRRMIPVSVRETGETGQSPMVTAEPGSSAIQAVMMKGKCVFGKNGKSDKITVKGEIEVPAGLNPRQTMDVPVGVGNIVDTVTLSDKGRQVFSDQNLVSRMSVKFPRLPKGVTTTQAGTKAKVSFQLSGPRLNELGLDTEGITRNVAPKTKVSRTIQTALVLGGVSYAALIEVDYSYSDTSGGSIIPRRQ
jgi:N-acetylneuraminic acid mutarotase